MVGLVPFIAFFSASLVTSSRAAVRKASLEIANKVISPDGFKRSYVLEVSPSRAFTQHSLKICFSWGNVSCASHYSEKGDAFAWYRGIVLKGWKGDTLNLNVINNLNDDTMLRSTSIVSFVGMLSCLPEVNLGCNSIGMAFSRRALIGPTVQSVLASALYHPITHFYMTLMCRAKLVPFGIIHILVTYIDPPANSISLLIICHNCTRYPILRWSQGTFDCI